MTKHDSQSQNVNRDETATSGQTPDIVSDGALAALDAFIEEGYDAVRGSGEMSAAYVVGACEALRDRLTILLDAAHMPPNKDRHNYDYVPKAGEAS